MAKKISMSAAFIFGATAWSLSSAAHAQSTVTLYGIVDNGVEFLTGVPGSNGKSSNLLRQETGGVNSSRIGFRGSEDLGGGLHAIFTLESGLDTTSGKLLQGGREFGRQAFVGLSGPYGALTLGRQRIPMYDYGAKFDPLNYYNYGLKETDAQFSGRADNSVKYTGKFGPFTTELLYSTGYDATIANGAQVPGQFKVGREISVGGGYSNGPLAATVTYDLRNGASVGTQGLKEQHAMAAVTYTVGRLEGYAGYRWLSSTRPLTSATQAHANEFWGGVTYQVSAPISVSAAAFWTDITSAGQRPLYLAATAAYSLSKRTSLYGAAGFVKNSNGSNLGLNGYDSDVLDGHNQTGLMLGIIHDF